MPTSAPPPPPPVVSATPAAGPSAEDLLRRRVARIAAVVAVVLVGGVAAYSFLSDGGPDHPDEWDPRVVDLVAFVEEERELRFDHPVHIDFLTPEEYSEVTRAGGGMEVEGEEGMDEMYEAASMLRSLGLLEGDVDLGGAFDDLNDTGTLAFYDPLTDRVVVRGTEVDVNLEATLVHELVHALQDQHVDLGRLGDMEDSGEAAAFRAVVEGDASLVESRYVAQLSEGDLTAYEETAMAQADAAFAEEIPGVLVASMGASYVLGEPLVGIVQAEGGWAAVDALLRDPPTSELALFDVVAHLDRFERVDVEPPAVDDGAVVIDDGELGAISLYLMLAARIDPVAALHATDAWAGDAFVTSRDLEGDLCTRIVAATRDATSADVLDAALSDWVAAAPERSLAEAVRRGERFDVTSCDPGPGSDMGIVVDPMEALALPATRSFVIYGVVDQGFEPEVGVCVWDELLVAVPVKALVAPAPPPRVVGQVQDTLMDALLSCRRDVG